MACDHCNTYTHDLKSLTLEIGSLAAIEGLVFCCIINQFEAFNILRRNYLSGSYVVNFETSKGLAEQ